MEYYEALRAYQGSPDVHPLTCGNDSTHGALKVKEKGDGPYLVCRSCSYIQTHIPKHAVKMGHKIAS